MTSVSSDPQAWEILSLPPPCLAGERDHSWRQHTPGTLPHFSPSYILLASTEGLPLLVTTKPVWGCSGVRQKSGQSPGYCQCIVVNTDPLQQSLQHSLRQSLKGGRSVVQAKGHLDKLIDPSMHHKRCLTHDIWDHLHLSIFRGEIQRREIPWVAEVQGVVNTR